MVFVQRSQERFADGPRRVVERYSTASPSQRIAINSTHECESWGVPMRVARSKLSDLVAGIASLLAVSSARELYQKAIAALDSAAANGGRTMKSVAARQIALGVGLGILLVFSGAAPARAQECSTSCSRYEEGECVEYMHTCTDTSSAPRPSYGAIAYGRNSGAYGFSHSWDSEAKAESVAMENCGKHGTDCEVMVWFERKCGAVAARSDSTVAYWGLGNSDGEARSVAMNRCAKDNGSQCEVKVSQCSK